MHMNIPANGDLSDDAQTKDEILTLAAHIISCDKDAALTAMGRVFDRTDSLDYTVLVCQEALQKVAAYLATTATPGETISITKTFGAVAHSIRSLVTVVRSPKP